MALCLHSLVTNNDHVPLCGEAMDSFVRDHWADFQCNASMVPMRGIRDRNRGGFRKGESSVSEARFR